MAVCPFAVQRLIPPGSNDPRIKARAVIWHVAVSMADSLHDYFDGPSGGIESHFYINWRGKIDQYRDTAYEADANLDANSFAISVETAGWANGRWNLLQRRAIKKLSLWLHEAEGIPFKVCESPTGSGHGYHTMWGAPSPWTPVAKSCPGPNRIKQFEAWLTSWLEKQNQPELTRGDDIDTALESLATAKGGAKRMKKIKHAIADLLSTKPWRKK